MGGRVAFPYELPKGRFSMSNMKSNNKKNKKRDPMALPNQAISAYHEGGDPLGQYTGTPTPGVGPCMPRLTAEGKIYMRVPERPIQDADDL
jgi:hypothetical protein